MSRPTFKNEEYHCFINASLQLILDMTMKNIDEIEVKDEVKKTLNSYLYNYKFNRNASVKQFLVDKYYWEKQEDVAEFLMTAIMNNNLLFYNTLYDGSDHNIYPLSITSNNIEDIIREEALKAYDTTLDVVIQLKRFDYDVFSGSIKLKQKVFPSKVITLKDKDNNNDLKFQLKGCIVHIGNSIEGGHYVYITFSDDGKPHLLVNDDKIKNYKPNEDNNYLTNGYIYLYKKIGYFDKVKYNDVLSKREGKMYVKGVERLLGVELEGGEERLLNNAELWLNDDSIELYMGYLRKKFPNCYFFYSQNVEIILKYPQKTLNENNQLVYKLNSNDYKKELRKFTHKNIDGMIRPIVNIFEKKYVFFPTNVGKNHWILVVYDTFNKKILGLDSLGNEVNREILDKLYEYLLVEFFYLYKKKEGQSITDYCLSENERNPKLDFKSKIDQQNDVISCGVFVCWYMYCLCYSLPLQTPILTNFREEILTKVFTNNLELKDDNFNIIKQWKEEDKIDLTRDDDDVEFVEPHKIVEPPIKNRKDGSSKKNKKKDGSSKKKHGSKKKIDGTGRKKKISNKKK